MPLEAPDHEQLHATIEFPHSPSTPRWSGRLLPDDVSTSAACTSESLRPASVICHDQKEPIVDAKPRHSLRQFQPDSQPPPITARDAGRSAISNALSLVEGKIAEASTGSGKITAH